MKKLLSFLPLLVLFTTLSAQQIPNGSFQYWYNTWQPNGWGTWASTVGFLNEPLADSLAYLAVRDTMSGDYVTDSSTLRLNVDTATLPSVGHVTLAGFASLGGASYIMPPTGMGLQYGYIQYTLRPDTLYFDYKFIPAPGFNDTALVVLALTKFDTLSHSRIPILELSIPLSTEPQWQRNVAFPLIDYYNPNISDTLAPDSMQLIIFASISAAPSLGTSLWIDTMRFDASVNPIVLGLPDINSLHGVSIYPNPASDRLQIAVEQREIGSNMKMYNAGGQEVYAGKLEDQLSAIDTKGFPPGVYSLRIYSPDRLTVYRGSVSIVH